MSAAVSPSDPPALQRASGTLRLAAKLREGATVLDVLYQSGCLKARLPRPEPGAWFSAVTLNSSGGIAAGDALASEIAAGAGTRLTVTAQAAERFYRALPASPPARVATRLSAGPGAALEWLPQESILFDGSALARTLEIELAADAWFLGVEWLVFGRTAMGETVRRARIADTIRLRRAGRLVLHDAIRLPEDVAAALARPAIGGGAVAMATILLASPAADAMLAPLRAALDGARTGIEAGVSAWDGMLLARLLATDAAALRRSVIAALAALRDGRPLPRVWLC